MYLTSSCIHDIAERDIHARTHAHTHTNTHHCLLTHCTTHCTHTTASSFTAPLSVHTPLPPHSLYHSLYTHHCFLIHCTTLCTHTTASSLTAPLTVHTPLPPHSLHHSLYTCTYNLQMANRSMSTLLQLCHQKYDLISQI